MAWSKGPLSPNPGFGPELSLISPSPVGRGTQGCAESQQEGYFNLDPFSNKASNKVSSKQARMSLGAKIAQEKTVLLRNGRALQNTYSCHVDLLTLL